MVNYIGQGGSTQYNVVEMVADNVTDIANLPKNVAPGSTCFVIENSSVYMFGGDKEWKELV